jgi:uncharacterized protein
MSINNVARANSWLAWLWPLMLLLTLSALAQDTPVPALSSPVTDLTQTLTPEQRAALESRLRAYEAQKGTQIAVLIVPTTQPETIEQYSIRVADQWKIGRQGVDDGVILLVAKNDRAVRIEVGTGLEGALPDVLASRIVSQVIVPRFREGDFAGGIDEAITRITALLEGEPLPEPERRTSSARERSGDSGNWLPVLLMFVFVGGNILRSLLGRVGGAFATAGIAGALVWLLTWTLGIAIIGAVVAFVFTLLFGGGGGGGFGGGRGPGGWTNPRRRRGGLSDGWILGGGLGGLGGLGGGGGRSSGGFGGGGFGGGGWSGGGGGFSGGGASGRW